MDGLIADIAVRGGDLGVELVDVAGHVDAVSARVAEQAQLFAKLGTDADGMLAENLAAAASSAGARAAVHDASRHVHDSQRVLDASLAGLHTLVSWVDSIGEQMEELVQTVEGVGDIAREVNTIARRTHVLALNAGIEAARAGSAGLGFTVIAASVRQLADQTMEAASDIDLTVGELADQIRALGEEGRQAREKAHDAERDAQSISATISSVNAAMANVDRHVAGIATATAASGERVERLVATLADLVRDVASTSDELEVARERVNTLLTRVERLIGLSAKTGAATVDTPFVQLAQRAAAETAELFERAVASGRITMDDLFDDDYKPVAGSNPQQFTSRFVDFTDREIPSRFEPLLQFDPRMRYAVITDRNGYIGTHNLSVSHRQGPDPVWNDAHCRNRRFFNGRTELAASRNTEPFLLQTYRRHLGGGRYALMKDVGVPIRVRGRHWGAVRVGYIQAAA
jgi:methyl-accepting chemotaxis protein